METIRKVLFWGAAVIFIAAIAFSVYFLVNGWPLVSFAMAACAATMPNIMKDNVDVAFR